MQRICKIIHTDLKPENTIVALPDEKLLDIIESGSIRKTKMPNQSKLRVDHDRR